MFDGSQSLVTLPTVKSRDHSLDQMQTKSFVNLAKSRSNLMTRKVIAINRNNEDPYSESTASMSIFKDNESTESGQESHDKRQFKNKPLKNPYTDVSHSRTATDKRVSKEF